MKKPGEKEAWERLEKNYGITEDMMNKSFGIPIKLDYCMGVPDENYGIKVEGTKQVHGDGAIRYEKDKGRFDLVESYVMCDILSLIEEYESVQEFIDADDFDLLFAAWGFDLSDKELDKNILYKNMIEIIIKICINHWSEKCNVGYNVAVNLDDIKNCFCKMSLELAIHFQKGAKTYGERNCEKGIPLWSFIDSGRRHLTQYVIGLEDEPHHISAIWNFMMAAWTLANEIKE